MSNIYEGDASDLADLACEIFDVMTGKELSSGITQEIADLFARYGWPLDEYREGTYILNVRADNIINIEEVEEAPDA